MLNFFIQATGIAGIVMAILAFQSNKHGRIMVYKTACETFFGIQFLLLGAFTGVAMNFIGSVRNLAFAHLVKKNKSTLPYIVLFSVILVAATALTWHGPISLLAMIGKISSTLAFGMKSTAKVRIFNLPSCFLWAIYDFMTGSLAGVCTEALSVASIAVAQFRFRKEAENEPAVKKQNGFYGTAGAKGTAGNL